ncbi:AAA family ATPase [bacterium]|nr:AAA family ATPase [bacterium]
MYKSFEIKNFKCFDHLKLDNLARVNLIAGKNSVGKSALLEALYLHCDGHNPEILSSLKNRRRPLSPDLKQDITVSLSRSYFLNFDTYATIELIGTEDGDGVRSVRLRLDRNPPQGLKGIPIELVAQVPGKDEQRFHAYFDSRRRVLPNPPAPLVPAEFRGAREPIDVNGDSKRFGMLVKGDKLKGGQVSEALKSVELRLERVELLPDEGTYLMHGHIRGISKPVPLPEMGDGILRVAGFVIIMGHCENGALLLDEIENGLHYSILEDVWKTVAEAARQFNVQVFATTHSYECIEAAHRAFRGEHADEFHLFRLERVKGKIRAFDYEPDVLEAAIETGLEVR